LMHKNTTQQSFCFGVITNGYHVMVFALIQCWLPVDHMSTLSTCKLVAIAMFETGHIYLYQNALMIEGDNKRFLWT